ncbi:MAG: hypothetical protein ACYC77_05150 [Coriobacteriia bacterium]
MTDEQGPTPAPAPQPVAAPPKRKRWPWVVAAIVLVALLGSCAGSVWLLASGAIDFLNDGLLGEGPFDGESIPPGSGGIEVPAWSGAGRYAVMQYYRDYLYPSVVVWDAETDKTRVLDNYRVLLVEPDAPVVWLEPVTARQADESTWLDGLGDCLDHKPERLVAWRLDDGSDPSARVSSKWRPIAGPGGYIAYPEINVLKGAGPSALWFNNEASSGEGVKAEILESTNTFLPVGWSPSGAYFAIEELAKEEGYTGETTEAPAPLSRKLVVYDAATGKVSAETELPETEFAGSTAMWDGTTDRLFWPVAPAMVSDAATELQLRTMTATGTAGDAFSEMGWDRPEGLSEVYFVNSLGSDPDGPLWSIDDTIYRIGPLGMQDLGTLNDGNGAWHPLGGLVTVSYGFSDADETEWTELVVLDEHGGSRRVVWKSPAQKVSFD